MQYTSESYFFLAGIVSVKISTLQIWVRIFPRSLFFLYASRLLSLTWQCSTALALPAVDSDYYDRRWMYWVLEIFIWIFLSDILSLIIVVFGVGWRIILVLVCLFCRLFCLLLKHDLTDSAIGTAVDFVAGFWVFDAAFPLNILLSKRWVIWKCSWWWW